MPNQKKNKSSFWVVISKVILGGWWSFVITIFPAFITVYQFFGGDKSIFANKPTESWSALTLVLFLVSCLVGTLKYQKELKDEAESNSTYQESNSVKKVTTGNDSIGVGRDVTNSNIFHNISVNGDFVPAIREIQPKQKRPDLTKLIEIRENGYLLKEEGVRLRVGGYSDWINNVKSWNEELLNALGEIDKDKAKLFRILGDVPRNETFRSSPMLSLAHVEVLENIIEKLRRLEKIIDEYLQIPL